MSRRAAGVLIVVVQFVLAHCAAAETHVVRITDFSYIPQDITIDEGDTVRWVWEAEQHNVVSGNVATFSKDGTFESEVEDTGYGYEVRFDRTLINAHRMAGNVYDYYCEPHAFMGMKGSITVRRQEKHFKAELRGWQEVPANESNETGSCSFTLDGDETELSVSCSHSISNPLASHIHQNVIGLSGPGVCGLQPTSPISQTCNALSSDTIDKLFTGGLYINVHTSAHPSGEIRGQIVVDAGGRSISGRVTDPNGNPLSGVRVSNGSAEQLSDTQGNYRIQNIENGVYQLTAHLSGQNIQPIRGVSPLLVNGTDGRNIDFTVVPMAACGTDSDLDGVCDREEESAGSDPDDPGSYPVSIQSPAYLLWNGFIGIRNIVEILNRGLSDLDLQLTLFDTTGQRLQHLEIRIAAEGQRDIILNDLPGFQLDAYGVLALEFAQERSADIEARMMYYRDDKANGGFEFVAATPLEKPLYGSTAVGFNTHQPSLDPDERTNVVAQWLALVNLDTEKAKTFTVIKNDQLGQEIERRDYRVEPFGRIDLEGGHLVPGIDHVGLVRIVPHDLVAPYQAQLYRYGGNAASAFAPDSYRFAFPLLARAGNGALQYAPVSIGAGSSNWLEVANTLDSSSVSVGLRLFTSNGSEVATRFFELGPLAQQHIDVGSLLPVGVTTGWVEIQPSVRNSVIGQSMYYFREAGTGRIETMYGSPLRQVFRSDQYGSYNLFLSMLNWLKIINVANQENAITLKVHTATAGVMERNYTLAPHASIDLGLHETGSYGTQTNSYGLVEIESTSPGGVLSELLRIGPRAQGFDFATPTPVR